MKYLLLLLFVVSAWSVFAQPDVVPNRRRNFQPSSAVTPASIATIREWWRFEDNPTNVNVTNWIGRIKGLIMTNATDSLRPTNSSNGVGFNGSTWLTNQTFFTITCGAANCASVVSNGSVWILVAPISSGLSGMVTDNSGGGNGIFTVATRQFEWFATSGNVIFDTSFTSGSPIDIGISVTNGATCRFYTNGVLSVAATSSDTSGTQRTFGAYNSGVSGLFNGKILDVAYFTNYLQAADYTTLHTYAKTRGVSP